MRDVRFLRNVLRFLSGLWPCGYMSDPSGLPREFREDELAREATAVVCRLSQREADLRAEKRC